MVSGRDRVSGALARGSQLYGFLVKLRVGGLSGKHPRPSTNDEFAFVYNGEVVLTLGEIDHLLVPGDSAVIPAGVNRRWRNESPESCRSSSYQRRPTFKPVAACRDVPTWARRAVKCALPMSQHLQHKQVLPIGDLLLGM